MADRNRDAGDRLLESMLAAAPIPDDGFSERVLKRIRRRAWIRRLTLPIALVLGVAVAAEPAVELLKIGARLAGSLPADWFPTGLVVSQLPLFLGGGLLFVIGWLSVRALEE
ncbi:MAG: hypothetical protein R3176_02090 [Woeseiaceae bacterium]|nr:hypothetical protein [Woeseiaceae bacterium]